MRAQAGGPAAVDAALLHVLRCAGCRSGRLRDRGTALACAACGQVFPVQGGVPVMIGDAVPVRGPLLDPAVARSVAELWGLPPGPVSAMRVRRASAARVRLRDGELPEDGRVLGSVPGAVPPPPPPPRDGGGRLCCEWLRDFIPRAMAPGVELQANVQLRNAGQTVMPGVGDGRVAAAFRWQAADGSALEVDDLRTPLPADLSPGQVLTLAMRLKVPVQAGPAALTVRLVQEGVRWLEPGFGPFQVEVREGAGFVPPPHWVLDGLGPHDPAGDRDRCAALMQAWLGQLPAPAGGDGRPRVLELGAAGPAAGRAEHEAVHACGDLLALQLERLALGRAVHGLCADLSDLPLAEAAFDAVLCFGAVRGADDPIRFLRALRGHLRPGGFVALFGETVGHAWPGSASAETLAELRRGRNPQGFNLADYALIFGQARLRATELVVDGVSLKARLEPEAADA